MLLTWYVTFEKNMVIIFVLQWQVTFLFLNEGKSSHLYKKDILKGILIIQINKTIYRDSKKK